MVKFFSPRALIAGSLLLWLVLATIGPITYDVTPSSPAILMLIAYLIFLFGGTFVVTYLVRDEISPVVLTQSPASQSPSDILGLDRVQLKRLFVIFLVLASVGIALRYYDLVVTKSYFNFESATDFRLNYDEGAVNFGPISILSAVMAPFTAALLILSVYARKKLPTVLKAVGIAIAVLFVGYLVMRGGRTSITLVAIMVMTAIALRGREPLKRKNRKKIVAIILAMFFGIGFFVYSLQVLVERLDTFGFSIAFALDYMQDQHHLQISPFLIELSDKSELVGVIVYTCVSLLHYFIHGFFQFFLLVDSFSLDNVAWGAYQFYPIFKFFGVLGLHTPSSVELISRMDEPGVYTTFFGPVFTDFGVWGFLYCFVVGAGAQLSWILARRGAIVFLFVYPYLAAVLFHSAFLNMVSGGMGLYFLVAMLGAGGITGFVKYLGCASDVTTHSLEERPACAGSY